MALADLRPDQPQGRGDEDVGEFREVVRDVLERLQSCEVLRQHAEDLRAWCDSRRMSISRLASPSCSARRFASSPRKPVQSVAMS